MFKWSVKVKLLFQKNNSCSFGKHITDAYTTETDTTELENLSRNIIDIFIIETEQN